MKNSFWKKNPETYSRKGGLTCIFICTHFLRAFSSFQVELGTMIWCRKQLPSKMDTSWPTSSWAKVFLKPNELEPK